MIAAIAASAQNKTAQSNVLVEDAKKKSVVYANKMAETLNLSKKQVADIYKLRLELSLAIKVIYHQFSNDEAKLIETAKIVRKQFHTGMLKVLDEKQATQWNVYKKEMIASQQYQDMINSTATFSGY
jgi:hypothetical protein